MLSTLIKELAKTKLLMLIIKSDFGREPRSSGRNKDQRTLHTGCVTLKCRIQFV